MPLPPSFPDLAALDLFSTVVALGSMSRAAAAHGISQPSASARIRHLERQVGVRLLDRSPTGSVPTDAGQLVAGWAEQLLRAAEDLRVGLDALDAREAGRLRVAASFTVAEYLLPGWLEQLRRIYPDQPVELHVANSTDVLAEARTGAVELGFIESPTVVDDLTTTVVGRDELVVIVAPDHPWVDAGGVDALTLASTPLVLREATSGTREVFDLAMVAAGHRPPEPALELGSTAAIKNAVASGRLAGVLSAVAVAGDIASNRLVAIPVSDLDLGRDLRAVRRATAASDGLVDRLLAIASAETA